MSEKMSAICQPKYPQAYYCQQCTPNLFVNSTLLELLLLNQVIVFIVSAKFNLQTLFVSIVSTN